MKSMTGFGRAVATRGGREITVEVRTLNHRFLQVRPMLPPGWERFEPDVERIVRARLQRGTVQVRVEVGPPAGRASMDHAARNLVEVHRFLERVKRRLGQKGPLPFEAVLALPAWLAQALNGTEKDDPAALWPAAERLIVRALAQVERARRREGGAIAREIRRRLDGIERRLRRAAARAPHVVAQYEARLRERVEALQRRHGVDANPADLSREIVVFADKADVSEEVQRLHFHVRRLRELLQAPRPIGRKMDFLLQEMVREATTLGAKSNDAEISTLSVEIRTEIERIREQAENAE